MSQANQPNSQSVRDHLLYSLSLPERALRSTAGVAGGVVREGANLLVPQAFRSSKCYEILVQQSLDFLTADVAGVRQPGTETAPEVEDYVAKKAVGGFVEMASLATLHLSPALLLAVVSDVAYGSQTYLKELAGELKREGIIDESSTIDHASDLLEAIRESSAVGATVFDTPPLSVEGVTEAIQQTASSVTKMNPAKVLPAGEIDRLWREMHEVANTENVSMLEVSGAMTLHALSRAGLVGQGALSTVGIAGTLFDRHVVDHYRTALTDIHTRGYYATLADVSQPYIEAVWNNFSTDRSTITQDLLSGKLVGQAARTLGRWFGVGEAAAEPGSLPAAEPASSQLSDAPPPAGSIDLEPMPLPKTEVHLPDDSSAPDSNSAKNAKPNR